MLWIVEEGLRQTARPFPEAILLIGFGAFTTAFFASLLWMIFQKKDTTRHNSPCSPLKLLTQRVGSHERWFENESRKNAEMAEKLEEVREQLARMDAKLSYVEKEIRNGNKVKKRRS